MEGVVTRQDGYLSPGRDFPAQQQSGCVRNSKAASPRKQARKQGIERSGNDKEGRQEKISNKSKTTYVRDRGGRKGGREQHHERRSAITLDK